MAIVEMKRISLLAMKQDRKKLLKAMQRMGCVEVSPITEEELTSFHEGGSANLAKTEETIGRLTWLIGQLSYYNKQKAPFLGSKPDADDADLAYVREHEADMLALIDQGEALERQNGELKGQLARLHVAQEQLSPWMGLDIPVEEIRSMRDVFQAVGTVDKTAAAALEDKWRGRAVVFQWLGEARENAYVWLAAHTSVQEELAGDLKAAGFTAVQFGEATGTIAQQMAELERERGEIASRQEGITKSWQKLAESLTRCKTWFDLLQIERDQLRASEKTISTGSAFMMRGWVPAAAADAVKRAIEELAPVCSVDITDPEEGEEPPVALRNGPMAAPYESIVTGFALPRYDAIDPTAVMAPFYACLFGMMLSDAGYGLVMAIAIPFLVKMLNPGMNSRKLLWVIFGGSLATVVWGAVYNTWFGFAAPWGGLLDPINDPMPVMVLCMGVGVIHLFAGLGVAAYMNCRRGKPLDAVYDQLSWAMMIIGLILLVLGGTAAAIGKWMAIAGVALILLFAGREKRNPFKRLISGLGALYGATSWISDILSYMRLFGMGLATGVIGLVINQLVGMVFSAGPVGWVIGSVLFVGAHTFNLGINALGAYVHSCRLQYIEFFGKFYEEGGVAFQPLNYQTRYVNIKQA